MVIAVRIKVCVRKTSVNINVNTPFTSEFGPRARVQGLCLVLGFKFWRTQAPGLEQQMQWQ